MTAGAPRTAFSSGEFIAVRREAVLALGSWEAAGVWQRICWRSEQTGSWVATIEQIADECCLSEHKTKVALQRIREAGWITAERASGRDRTMRWEPVWTNEANGESPLYVTGNLPSTPITKTVETPPTPVDGGLFLVPEPERVKDQRPDLDAEFAAFWAVYPSKVGKRAARTAYARARRDASAEQILHGLRAQLPVLAAKERRYVAHPTTWLNQGRWEDEVEVPPGAAPEPVNRAEAEARFREYKARQQAEMDALYGPHEPIVFGAAR